MLKFSGFRKLPVQAWRTYFQNVRRPRNQILHIEDYAQLIADDFAILVAYAFRLIDVDAEEAFFSNLPFDVHHVHSNRPRHALGCLADALLIHHSRFPMPPYSFLAIAEPAICIRVSAQQKSGLSHTECFDRLRLIQYSHPYLQKQATEGQQHSPKITLSFVRNSGSG